MRFPDGVPEEYNFFRLSEEINWRVLPWEWKHIPDWWIARLVVWLNAKQQARDLGQPMSAGQLADAPNTMNHEEAEEYLRSIGAI